MIHLNITAETPVELKKTLVDLARSLDTATPENCVHTEKKVPENTEKVIENTEKVVENTEKVLAEEEVQDFQPDTPVPVDAPALPSMEEARAALNALRQKKGAAAVREILKAHGVSSFTELDPKDYPQVMKEAVVDG